MCVWGGSLDHVTAWHSMSSNREKHAPRKAPHLQPAEETDCPRPQGFPAETEDAKGLQGQLVLIELLHCYSDWEQLTSQGPAKDRQGYFMAVLPAVHGPVTGLA